MFGKKICKDFYEGKTTLPIIILFQRSNFNERQELLEIFKKDKRNKDDFDKALKLIKKYSVIKETFKRAEYFVNVSRDAISVLNDTEEKRILQNLTNFSLNRKF